MKILIIGLDRTVLEKDSPVVKRFRLLGEIVDRCDVVIPASEDYFVDLSEKVRVFQVRASNKLIAIFRLYFKISYLLKSGNYDIISTKDPYFIGFISALLAQKYSLGLEIQIHGFEKFNFIRKKIARWVLSRADGIRTVSKRLKNRLVEDFNISSEIIIVNPIFIDCNFFRNQRFIHSLNKKEDKKNFTFLTISRLVPIKNIDLQIKAIYFLIKKYPLIKLLIVGDGPEKHKLNSITKKLGLVKNVLFVGSTSDITKFLTQADCFILTSFDEGYGLAPLEAACFGLPVIMTDVGCAGEIISDQENGLIIPINNKQSLINAMAKIIEDSYFRETVSKNNLCISSKIPGLQENLLNYYKSWDTINVRRHNKFDLITNCHHNDKN